MDVVQAIPLHYVKRYGGFLLFLALLVVSPSLQSQQPRVAFTRTIPSGVHSPQPRLLHSLPDTVRVFAIMVDFQPDTDPRTTGDGRFSLQPTNVRLIDPPPHDSAYFAYKLLFLENYFRKASNGKLIVKGEVFGRRVTLSKPMSAYSPAKDGSNDRPLADLVVESWRRADSLYPFIPFGRYHAFILFHAGVGRDIDVVSLLGFDPTPHDIPSLYVGLSTLQKFLNDPTYAGVPVNNGTVRITNTMILPETQTRVIESGGRRDTLQLGINGLLVNSFGSFLGLPDLFDTKTGRSAIGQFGLMDVASIFAFDGLFPPEPSAWEKVALGWVTPVTLTATSQTVVLPAVGLTAHGDDVIYKVPINAREYFLIENRNRDPHRNGQKLTVVEDGQIVTRHFSKDTTGFSFGRGRGVTGNLIDVEDFDWALPGLIGANETAEGGGILIWHIDEEVISRKLWLNKVNADPARRGVALEEADGSLDIGQNYGIFNAGLGSELGSPYDAWFEGNPIAIYKNLFDDTSVPNSKSNTGSRSLVSIGAFSRRGSTMTVTVRLGDATVKPLAGFPQQVAGDINSIPFAVDLDGDGVREILATRTLYTGAGGRGGSPTGKGAILAWRQNGKAYFADSPRGAIVAEIDKPSILSPAFLRHPVTGALYVAATAEDGIYLWNNEDRNGDHLFDRVAKFDIPAISIMAADSVFITFGGPDGVLVLSLDGTARRIAGAPPSAYDACLIGRTARIAAVGETGLSILDMNTARDVAHLSLAGRVDHIVSGDFLGNGIPLLAMIVHDVRTGGVRVPKRFVLADQEGKIIVDSDLVSRYCEADESLDRPLAVADLDGDGRKEIVVVSSKGRLVALNTQGFLVDGFPVQLGKEARAFRSGPLIGDIDGDGAEEVLNVDAAGDLWVYTPGNTVPMQPFLRVSSFSFWMPTLFPIRTSSGTSTLGLVAGDAMGSIAVFEFQAPYVPEKISWPMYRYDEGGRASTLQRTASARPRSTEFLPKSMVYNWPNPVYGNVTNIRYYVSENARVTVRIFDYAGKKVAELSSHAVGGVDNELLWDVSNIQSGVYLAHVEASGAGRTESAFIKIAVVK